MEQEPPSPVVVIDAVITRRKRFHCLMGADGVPIFKSRIFGEVIAAARAHGLNEVELINGDEWPMGAPLAVLKLGD